LLDAQVTVRATPASASTLATSCKVCPGLIVALFGDTATLRTCVAGAVTVTVTLAFLVASAEDVAVMLAVPAATAVTRPVASTDATAALLLVHVAATFDWSWTLEPTAMAVTGAPV